jgi:hypothetical protein
MLARCRPICGRSCAEKIHFRWTPARRIWNFEMVCIALRTGDCDDGVNQAIATKLIALAKTGERNPDILCEEVLKDIRLPQPWTASEAARSSVLQSGQKTQN